MKKTGKMEVLGAFFKRQSGARSGNFSSRPTLKKELLIMNHMPDTKKHFQEDGLVIFAGAGCSSMPPPASLPPVSHADWSY
jgi:hypothetical protein